MDHNKLKTIAVASDAVARNLKRLMCVALLGAGWCFALADDPAPAGAFESFVLFGLSMLAWPRAAPRVEVTYRDAFGVMDGAATQRLADQLERLNDELEVGG